jgi:hypothetical protein
MRIPAAITIVILTLLMVGCAGSQRTRPPAEWERGPSDPGTGLTGPTVVESGVFAGDISLGKIGTKNGHPENTATVPPFNCSGEGNYCEVTFFANVPLKDNETIRVKVSAGPNKNAIGYITKYSGSSWEYRLALKAACGDDITVTFDWGSPGNNAGNIESEAYIWALEYLCTDNDRTNTGVSGRLFDADGNELNK